LEAGTFWWDVSKMTPCLNLSLLRRAPLCEACPEHERGMNYTVNAGGNLRRHSLDVDEIARLRPQQHRTGDCFVSISLGLTMTDYCDTIEQTMSECR